MMIGKENYLKGKFAEPDAGRRRANTWQEV